jgi:DNA polymerase
VFGEGGPDVDVFFIGEEACRPWLNAEIRSLQPGIIVCLGATAVRSAFGKDFPILKNRGRWITSLFSSKTLVTVHPSSVLRAPDPEVKEKAYADFVADLNIVAKATGSQAQSTKD